MNQELMYDYITTRQTGKSLIDFHINKINNHKDTNKLLPVTAQCLTVNATGCGFKPHSRKWNIYSNLYIHFFALVSRQSAALSPATQYALSPKSGGECGPKCLNTGVLSAYLTVCGIRREADFFYLFRKRIFLKTDF